MGLEWSMKAPNELEAEALIQTAGQLLSLGLMISARDYLEALHLRAKQDPQCAWWSQHLELLKRRLQTGTTYVQPTVSSSSLGPEPSDFRLSKLRSVSW